MATNAETQVRERYTTGYRYRVSYLYQTKTYDRTTGTWKLEEKPGMNETFVDVEHIHEWAQIFGTTGINVHITKVERQPIDPEWEPVPWPPDD